MNKDSVISFLIDKYPIQKEKKFIERFTEASSGKSYWWIYILIAVFVLLLLFFILKKN